MARTPGSAAMALDAQRSLVNTPRMATGTVIGGRYELRGRLGSGGSDRLSETEKPEAKERAEQEQIHDGAQAIPPRAAGKTLSAEPRGDGAES